MVRGRLAPSDLDVSLGGSPIPIEGKKVKEEGLDSRNGRHPRQRSGAISCAADIAHKHCKKGVRIRRGGEDWGSKKGDRKTSQRTRRLSFVSPTTAMSIGGESKNQESMDSTILHRRTGDVTEDQIHAGGRRGL